MRANVCRMGVVAGLLFAATCVSGCTRGAIDAPTQAILVTANKGPDVVGTGEVNVPKRGTATSYYIHIPYFPDFAWGDSSLETASQQGGITQVAYSDSDNLFILLFGRRQTIVHGR